MPNRTSRPLPAEAPPIVMERIRRLVPPKEMQAVEALTALRAAAQQADNAVTEWLEGSVGSPGRFQILMLLWAAKERRVAHKEIVATLGVTRATVSGLMGALEREGLVKSSAGADDRRTLLAVLTARGTAVITKAIDDNLPRLRVAFAPFSSAELTTFMSLLQRARESFASAASAKPQPGRPQGETGAATRPDRSRRRTRRHDSP